MERNMETRQRGTKRLGKSRKVIPTVTLLVLVQLIGLMGIAVINMAFAEPNPQTSETKAVVVYRDGSHTFTSEGNGPIRLLGGTRYLGSGTGIQRGLAYLPQQVSGSFRPLI